MVGKETSAMSPDDDPQSELNILRREVRQLQADVRNSALQVAAGQDDIIQLRTALAAAETEIEEALGREAHLRTQLNAQTLKKEHVEITLAAAEALVSSLREMMEGEGDIPGSVPIVHEIIDANDTCGEGNSTYASRETVEGYELEQVLNSIAEPAVQTIIPAQESKLMTVASSQAPLCSVEENKLDRSPTPTSLVTSTSPSDGDQPSVKFHTPSTPKRNSGSLASIQIPSRRGAKTAAERKTPNSPTLSVTNPLSSTSLPRKPSQRVSSSNLLLSAFGQGSAAVVHQGATIHTSSLQTEQNLPSEIEGIAKPGPAPREKALTLKVESAVDDAHSGEIFSVASSLDSKWFASGGDDRTIRVYDVKGKSCSTIGDLPRTITALGFHPLSGVQNPESLVVCAGSSDGSLRLFRRNARRKAKWSLGSVFPVHTQAIRSLEFTSFDGSTDSSMLLTCSTDRMIKLTDVEQGKRPFAISTTSAVLDLSFFDVNSNGVIVSGHKDGGLRLWSPQTSPANVGGAKVHNKGIVSLKCLDDGYSVVSLGRDDVIRLSDIRKNVAIVREMEGVVQCTSDWHRLAVEGRHVVCGKGRMGNLGVWNVDTGKMVRNLPSQLSSGDSDVIDMVTRKLRSPGGIVIPLWTTSGSLISAHRTRQVSFWSS